MKSRFGCISLALLVCLLSWAALYFSPIGRHLRYFGEAERIVDDFVVPFRNELVDPNATVESILDLPKYAELKQRVIPPNLEDGEVARFRMNEMFEIGVLQDGSIMWHSD